MASRASLPRDIKIGDTFPVAQPIDRGQLTAARVRRGQLQAAVANHRSENKLVKQARKILDDREMRLAQESDPVFTARRHLMRRGFKVVCGTVFGFHRGTFMVGSKLRTAEEMIALAERQGWKRPDGWSPPRFDPKAANDGPATPIDLLRRAEAFLARSRMTEREFTDLCNVRAGVLSQLRRGVMPRPFTVRRIVAYLDGVGA